MIYIIVALKIEAQAFVDKYRLKKEKLATYLVFSNENIRVVVGGIGMKNARDATQALINSYDITDNDIYLNIGICGADTKYQIGKLLDIGTVVYQQMSYTFAQKKRTIHCEDTAIEENIFDIVDMESYGFYDAVIHNPAIKNFYILKVVSDHFEPEKVTKDGTKKLLFDKLSEIEKIIGIEKL